MCPFAEAKHSRFNSYCRPKGCVLYFKTQKSVSRWGRNCGCLQRWEVGLGWKSFQVVLMYTLTMCHANHEGCSSHLEHGYGYASLAIFQEFFVFFFYSTLNKNIMLFFSVLRKMQSFHRVLNNAVHCWYSWWLVIISQSNFGTRTAL